MRQDQLQSEYDQFFNKSEAGKYFISYINKTIDDSHKSAEEDFEFATGHAQRAKGARLILNHIQSVTTKAKKGKNIE